MKNHEVARGEILNVLKRDVFGPYNGVDEILTELPVLRYSTGVLFPQGALIDPEEDDGGPGQESQTGNDDTEPALSLCNVMNPSSYGMTFTCKKGTETVELSLHTATYEETELTPKKTQVAECSEKKDSETDCAKTAKAKNWLRKPVHWSETVVLSTPREISFRKVAPGLSVSVRVREADSFGDTTVTASVINENRVVDPSDVAGKSKNSFFQINIQVRSCGNERPFVDKKGLVTGENESEIKSIRLLYRETNSFAIGHGCAATWNNTKQQDTDFVETCFVPEHLVQCKS